MQQQKVPVGLSTATLGGVSVASYVLAVIAFLDGARDEATITLAVMGTVALVTMAAGRFWQAVTKIKASNASRGVASSGIAALPAQERITRGPSSEPEEAGDPDALPEYPTDTDPPPDEGDAAPKGA